MLIAHALGRIEGRRVGIKKGEALGKLTSASPTAST